MAHRFFAFQSRQRAPPANRNVRLATPADGSTGMGFGILTFRNASSDSIYDEQSGDGN